jgi:transposase-like protein
MSQKSEAEELEKELLRKLKRLTEKPEKCPQCGSTSFWKDGRREGPYGPIQRYIYRECIYRFSTW